jgi:hypothetical protein
MSDAWETRHGLDPVSAQGDAGAEGDPDRDTLLNWQEYVADTSPQDGLDFPALAGVARVEGGLAISWRSSMDRVYSILSNEALSSPWVAEPWASGIRGNGGLFSFTNPEPNQSRTFYGLEVRLP